MCVLTPAPVLHAQKQSSAQKRQKGEGEGEREGEREGEAYQLSKVLRRTSTLQRPPHPAPPSATGLPIATPSFGPLRSGPAYDGRNVGLPPAWGTLRVPRARTSCTAAVPSEAASRRVSAAHSAAGDYNAACWKLRILVCACIRVRMVSRHHAARIYLALSSTRTYCRHLQGSS